MNNVNPLRLRGDTVEVENLLAPMNPMPHASVFVARHKREGVGHVCEAQTFVAQFTNQAYGAARVVLSKI